MATGACAYTADAIRGIFAMIYYDPGPDLPGQPTLAQIRLMQAVANSYISNREIAAHLGLTIPTITTTCTELYRRIGARSKTHALVLMWQRGYVKIG